MGLAHTELTILDFDRTCAAQSQLLARFPHRIVALTALPQSNLYCADATFRRIEAFLPPDAHRGITLLGTAITTTPPSPLSRATPSHSRSSSSTTTPTAPQATPRIR
jgi:hypothetical protein